MSEVKFYNDDGELNLPIYLKKDVDITDEKRFDRKEGSGNDG